MKTLIMLATISIFSISAAAANACDGMKGHEKAGDSQAKNESGKAKKESPKPDQKS